jgi:hypothetical protein
MFDTSRGVVVAAFAEPPAPPGFPHEPGAPFGPAALTLPATVGVAPSASKPNDSAAANSRRCSVAWEGNAPTGFLRLVNTRMLVTSVNKRDEFFNHVI